MKIFLDTAELSVIEKWLKTGILDGITTNPTILKNAGFKDPQEAWKKIIGLIRSHLTVPISLSTEVFCDTPDAMIEQARNFVKILGYDEIAIKIPILGTDGSDCLAVIHKLASEKIQVNCTGCITWFQAFTAAKAGARFVSLLYRRIFDAGLDGAFMIGKTRSLIDQYHLNSEIIAGSIRKQEDVIDAYQAGAHIVTIPPKFLPGLLYNQMSVKTQVQFLKDAGMSV